MTKATLEQGQALHFALCRVSSFLEMLSEADPSCTNLLLAVTPPARQMPGPTLYDDDAPQVYAAEPSVTLSSVNPYLHPTPPEHPLFAEFYAELAGWLLERLPALEAELKQEFEVL